MKHQTRLSLTVAGLIAGLAAACGGTPPPVALNAAPLTAPDADNEATRAAALRAFAARKWAVTNEADGKMTGRWEKGNAFLEAEIVYTADQAEIRYIDSDHGAAPEGMVPRRYANYMRNLRQSLEEELARPGKEAAGDAAKAERMEKKRLAEDKRRKRMVLIAKKTKVDAVREKIIAALRDRKYTVEGEEDGVITARWSKSDLFYSLKISYNESQVELVYLDSDHKDDDSDEGVQIIDERYIDYMGRLSRSLTDSLN